MKLRGDSQSVAGPTRPQVGIGSGPRAREDQLDGVTVRWLQYAGLQHLASPVALPDQRQLLHDLLLQGHGLWNSNLNGDSSVITAKTGLLDLKSIDDGTGFLIEDSAVESFDLLPVSPPKGIRNDLHSNGSVKSEVKSNNKTEVSTIVKQNKTKGKNMVKEIMTEPFDLFPISPPKIGILNDFNSIASGKSEVKSYNNIRGSMDKKKAKDKGKHVHKDNTDQIPLDNSPFRSPRKIDSAKVEEYKEASNTNFKKSERTENIKDVSVVAEQFDSPTRGLYGDSNLMREEESKRKSQGRNSDFAFMNMKGEESKRISSSSSKARTSLGRRKNKLKEKNNTKEKIMEVKIEPLEPNLNPKANNDGKELNTEFNSIMEELSKWDASRSARSSSARKNEIVANEKRNKDLDNAFSSAMEELSKLQLIRSARSSSASKKDFVSKESNLAKIATKDVVAKPISVAPVSLPSVIHSEFNTAIEELSKWQSTKSARSSSASRREIISKPIEAKPFDFAQNPSLDSKEDNSPKIRNSDEFENGTMTTKPNSKDINISNVKIVKIIDEQEKFSTPRRKTNGISSKEKNSARIRVVVRKRSLNKKEVSKKDKDVLQVNDYENLTIHEPKSKVDLTAYIEKHDFHFDAVLDEHVTNDEVYNNNVGPVIPAIFEGAKITCFAFGQTGSGKTYTMRPLPLRASSDIIDLLHQRNYHSENLKLSVSYFEIYGKKIIDLLNDRKNLCIREDGNQQVCIVGLQEYEISDAQTVHDLIQKGNALRSTGSTGANEESSRSHSILQLAIKKYPAIPLNSFMRKNQSNQGGKIVGKISFVDLAGSERGADNTHNDREKRNEGVEINKSLLALKECIRALDNDKNHVPFRGSKLTEVLRDSFIGDSRTVMICCVSPSSSSCEQTLNSLRYAERVKNLSKGNSKKEQVSSPMSNEPKDIFEQEDEENIAIVDENDEEDIYSPATEFGETSFRFMPNFYNLNGREGGEEPLVENGTLGQNKMDNNYHLSYGSSLDFGTQNLLQIFSKEEDIVASMEQNKEVLNIDTEIKALIEEESSRLSTFSVEKEDSNYPKNLSFRELDEDQMQDNFNSSFDFMINPISTNSLNIQEEDNIYEEPLIASRDDQNNLDNMNDFNLSPKSQDKTSSAHVCEDEFSSDNGDIKTILEEKDYTLYAHNKENIDTLEIEYESSARIDNENRAREESHEEITEEINADNLDLDYEDIMNQNQIKHQDEEPLIMMNENYDDQIGSSEKEYLDELKEEEAIIETIQSQYSRSNTKLSPLKIRQKDIQIISSSSSPTTKSETSTINSLNTENRKISNKSPRNRTPRAERTKKKRENPINGSTSKSNSTSEKEKKKSEEKRNKIEGSKKEWPINKLFQEEEALLSAHRKVIQNTMDILREELSMLVEVDKPGSFINNYVMQLSLVLSRKAADLASLQTRVVRFRQCVKEQERIEQDKLGRMSFP